MDKAWKQRERQVAKYFGGQRTPLSGGNGKITRADVIHDSGCVECKLREEHTAITLRDETNEMAKKEKKTPGIALGEKGRPGFCVMVHSDDVDKI